MKFGITVKLVIKLPYYFGLEMGSILQFSTTYPMMEVEKIVLRVIKRNHIDIARGQMLGSTTSFNMKIAPEPHPLENKYSPCTPSIEIVKLSYQKNVIKFIGTERNVFIETTRATAKYVFFEKQSMKTPVMKVVNGPLIDAANAAYSENELKSEL